MPAVTLVKRNFAGIHEMYTSLGPRIDTVGCGAKGLTWRAQDQVELLGRTNGTVTEGVGSGRPSVADDVQAAEAMLILSASTNRKAASDAFAALGRLTGGTYAELLPEHLEERITERELEAGPRRPFPSPEWSGEQSPGKPHTAFALNVDRLVPWRTLTGRIQNLIDHDWFKELGELLPGYHPPLSRLELEQHSFDGTEPGVALRYVDSEEEGNLPAGVDMLHPTAERDDLTIWMSPDDALAIAVSEADAVELSNRNGSATARVIIAPGVPRGLCRLYRGYASIVAGNPLMRILLKPTHMVGGYAHLSYAANYYGCMGAQRDQYVTVRPRRFTTGPEGNIAKEQ
jgi:nitrate reductase alpha subunit